MIKTIKAIATAQKTAKQIINKLEEVLGSSYAFCKNKHILLLAKKEEVSTLKDDASIIFDFWCAKYGLERIPDFIPGIWSLVDTSSRHLYYNKNFTKTLLPDGLPKDYLIGKTMLELPCISQTSAEYNIRATQSVCVLKKEIRYIHCFRAKTGGWLVFEIVKYPIFNLDGAVEAVIVKYIDQTSKSYLNLALAMAANIKNQYSESANNQILIKKTKINFELNRKESECLFYLSHGVSRKEIAEINSISYRAVTWLIQSLKAKFNAATTRDLIVKYLISCDANKIPDNILTKETVISLTEILGATEEAVKILEPKVSNKKFEWPQKNFIQVLDMLPGTWAVFDKQSRFIYYNHAYSKMVGADHLHNDYLIGKKADAIPTAMSSCANFFWMADELVKTNKKPLTILNCLLGANDKWLVLEVNKVPIMNSKDEVEAILCQYVDQTNSQAFDLVLSLWQEPNMQPDFGNDSCRIYGVVKTSARSKVSSEELEYIFYLNRGYSLKEIAVTKNIPYRTLSHRINKLKVKFQAASIEELVTKALLLGYVKSIPKNLFNKQMYIIFEN